MSTSSPSTRYVMNFARKEPAGSSAKPWPALGYVQLWVAPVLSEELARLAAPWLALGLGV